MTKEQTLGPPADNLMLLTGRAWCMGATSGVLQAMQQQDKQGMAATRPRPSWLSSRTVGRALLQAREEC